MMKLKFFVLLPLLSAFFLFVGCESEPENEKVDELEEFVIQVEESVKDGEIKDWNEFEQEYHQRLDAIEEGADKLSENVEKRVDNLENRWEKAKADLQGQS